jgi:uncharacterized LabA/DUF88 family protein
MQVLNPLFQAIPPFRRMMVFIDGENLVFRFQEMCEKWQANESFMPNVSHRKDVYVWVTHMLPCVGMHEVIRCTLYTYIQGSEEDMRKVEEEILNLSFRGHNNSLLPNKITPSVFKKARGQKAKGVDIGICVDALSHAARNHYDTAVILSGDRDYLKLIREIQSYGKQCYVGAFSSGLSYELKNAADHFFLLDEPFFDKVTTARDPRK